jgi:hypothetical protein
MRATRREPAVAPRAPGGMLDKKKAGLPTETVKAFAPPRAVPDLFEAFRQSLAPVLAETANDEVKSVNASRLKKSKPKVVGQRDMLLPGREGPSRSETGESFYAATEGRLTPIGATFCPMSSPSPDISRSLDRTRR